MAPKWINVILWTLVSVNALTLVLGGLITWLGYAIPVRLNQYGLLPELAIAGGFASLLVACLGICALNYSSHYALNVYGFSCSIFILLMVPGIIPDASVKSDYRQSGASSRGAQPSGANRHLLLDIIYFSLIFLLVILLVFAFTLAHYLRRKEAQERVEMMAAVGRQTDGQLLGQPAIYSPDQQQRQQQRRLGDEQGVNLMNYNQLDFIQTIPHIQTMPNITTAAAPAPTETTSSQLYEQQGNEHLEGAPAHRTGPMNWPSALAVWSPSGHELSLDSLDCTCTLDELIQQQQRLQQQQQLQLQLQQQPMGTGNQNCCLSPQTTTTTTSQIPIIDHNNQHHQQSKQNKLERGQEEEQEEEEADNKNNKLASAWSPSSNSWKRQPHNGNSGNQFNHMNFTKQQQQQQCNTNNKKNAEQTDLIHVDDDDDGGDGGGGGGGDGHSGSGNLYEQNDANEELNEPGHHRQLHLPARCRHPSNYMENKLVINGTTSTTANNSKSNSNIQANYYGRQYNANSFKSSSSYCSNKQKASSASPRPDIETNYDNHYDNASQLLVSKGFYWRDQSANTKLSHHQRSKSLPRRSSHMQSILMAGRHDDDDDHHHHDGGHHDHRHHLDERGALLNNGQSMASVVGLSRHQLNDHHFRRARPIDNLLVWSYRANRHSGSGNNNNNNNNNHHHHCNHSSHTCDRLWA